LAAYRYYFTNNIYLCNEFTFALAHGADKGLFYYGDWIKEPGVAIVSCNDGLRPVIIKLEATEEEAKIDYTPIER